ncbi:MAG: DUF3604 domain-containing protein [Promethearchaeota archaeon]|nr:MAG: DUF3604 domain-containing protein [Candidatus Lokiarchaeota archaeon]
MTKIKKQDNMDMSLPEREWSRLRRVPRLIVYGFGIVTLFWYFWCIIGLAIGIIYYIFLKDIAWKRNGIVLACAIGFITIFVHFYKGLAPLTLIIWFNVIFIISYGIILLILEILKRKKRTLKKIIQWIGNYQKLSNKKRKAIELMVIFIPISLWTSVSIDLGVMFDNSPQLIWVNVPTMVKINESFDITVEAWDPFERLSAVYRGRVEFSIKSFNLTNYDLIINSQTNLPEPYTFTGQVYGSDIAYEIRDGKDNGRHAFQASINTPGIHYILVNDSKTGNTYYSNPIIVKNFTSTEPFIAWGDIHTHSQLSDGTGTPEHSFYFARYIACLDFYALTDHGEIMLFAPWSLDHLESSTNAAYEPSKFVTIHGIEWTCVRTGHYVCIFSGDTLLKSPIIDSYFTVTSPQALWNVLDDFTSKHGVRALALPHHTTKKAYIQDWTYNNPKYVKLAEVSSVHGEFLFEQRHPLNYIAAIDEPPIYTNGSSIIDAFNMGYRMTMYIASDEHDGHPGHSLSHNRAYIGHQRPYSLWHTRNEHPYPGGLTAVYVNNLTREGVFTGLENQRIYANSDHGRPILNFHINGTKVGDGSTFIASNQTEHRKISVFLSQDGAPVAQRSIAASVTPNWIPNWNADIEIIKNGKLWYTEKVSTPIVNISIIDTEPITGVSYENSCIKIGNNYYTNQYSDNPIDPSNLNTGGYDYYLIRVVGENGRMSYAGPIWIEY